MRFPTALALLALLAAAPAGAQDSNPARGQRANPAAPVQGQPAAEGQARLRVRFEAAITDLQQRAAARGATREDYQRVADQITAAAQAYDGTSPAILPLRQRAAARLADIEARARAGAVEAQEFDALRDQLVDLDLEIALGRLRAAAKAQKFTRAEYQAFVDAWTARAAAAKEGNPELDAVRSRAKAALEAVAKRAQAAAAPTEEEVQALGDCVAEYRTFTAVGALEKRALEKKASQADYDDVVSAVRAASGEEIAKKVQARLAELQAAVEGGRITREQFAELRGMLVKRARAAASGG
ncbi:MAG: hypothetical protein JNK02_10275 [Planctomycetes bacterium]|nr:hypothetical protein [Planctomycetota bacterium]